MFSIAPLLLIVISIAELVFGDEAARVDVNKGAPRLVKQQHSCAGVTPRGREIVVLTTVPEMGGFLAHHISVWFWPDSACCYRAQMEGASSRA